MHSKHTNHGANASGKKTASQNHSGHTNPPIPPATTELEVPPPNGQPDNSDKCKKHWLDYAAFGVEILGFAGLVVYCIITYGVYCANRKAADAAKTAADTASQALQLDQRAWIGPVEIVGPKFTVDGKPTYVAAGQKTTLGVFITNSGKSPGLKVKTKTRLKAVDSGEVFVSDYPPTESNITDSVSVVQPGMRMELDSLPSGVALVPDHIRKIREETGKVYFYGEITYVDIFTIPHVTHFCVVLAPDLQHLITCETYNDAN